MAAKAALTLQASLVTAVDFLFTFHMLLQSEAHKCLELADMSSMDMDNEGPTLCTALVIRRDHGKTNKASRIEFSAAMRHKDPLLLPCL